MLSLLRLTQVYQLSIHIFEVLLVYHLCCTLGARIYAGTES